MKKSNIALLGATGAAALAGMNFVINQKSNADKVLAVSNGRFYHWNGMNIFYTRKGLGTPILFIHDMDIYSQGLEWDKVSHILSQNHTVYTLDLPGCGRSDSGIRRYTAFTYTRMILDFIDEIFEEPVDIVASHRSAQMIIAAASSADHDQINHIFLINPTLPAPRNSLYVKVRELLQVNFLRIPVIGTALYNSMFTREKIREALQLRFHYEVPAEVLDRAYAAVHRSFDQSRNLYCSIRTGYLYQNVTKAVRKVDPDKVHFLFTKYWDLSGQYETCYRKLLPKASFYNLHHSGLYPQIEQPKKTAVLIEQCFT